MKFNKDKNKFKKLSGNWLSSILQAEILEEVQQLKTSKGRVPGLGVILVGNNPASLSYVKRKSLVAEQQCGFITKDLNLADNCTETELSEAIKKFNLDPEIDGILLQLPLPRHLSANKFIDQIDPRKDADALHPLNQGIMFRGEGYLKPCTPLGSMALIDLAFSKFESDQENVKFSDIPQVDLKGKTAVIIGRSILVGKPLHSLLLNRDCTVIQAHSKTANIAEICKQADIVIAAAGVPQLVKSDWVKKGAVVIDVGINRNSEGFLIGDVDFEEIASHTSAITPVPGGVGPMTVAMLMKNTLEIYKRN